LVLVIGLVAWFACSQPTPVEVPPNSVADCAGLAGAAVEDCRFEFAKRAGADERALAEVLASIPDPLSRDLVLVRLAFDAPGSSARLCAGVTTAVGRQRCQQVTGRPHLQRGH
jgi:hypothetical protein